jgi:hypothetical protein
MPWEGRRSPGRTFAQTPRFSPDMMPARMAAGFSVPKPESATLVTRAVMPHPRGDPPHLLFSPAWPTVKTRRGWRPLRDS